MSFRSICSSIDSPKLCKSGCVNRSYRTCPEIPSFYERALAIDPSYYDALYQLGAYYFNEGAEIKRLVNAMDMETYKKEGKAVEEKLAAKYQLALPYFERALSVKKDEDLKEIVRQVYLALKIDKQVD